MGEKSNRAESCPFVVDETPYCMWAADMVRLNLDYLDRIDPAYFHYIADTFDQAPEGQYERYAAIALRTTYSNGLEALFALLCAFVQAPRNPVGWLLKYTSRDLYNVVRKIDQEEPVLHRLNAQAVNWDTIADGVLLVDSADAERDVERAKVVAGLWRLFAREFLSKDFSDEYNSIKHGFRVSMHGLCEYAGKDRVTGEEAIKVSYGTIYPSAEALHSDKVNFRTVLWSRNWSPERLAQALRAVATSIAIVKWRLSRELGTESPEYQLPLEYLKAFMSGAGSSSSNSLAGLNLRFSPEESSLGEPVHLTTKREVLNTYVRHS